ncbi:spermine synthase [Candidatus Woesearchaeota archaeon]|nr:MAG: spermine synthase [Candidatus Woesearchaeota archaeon]
MNKPGSRYVELIVFLGGMSVMSGEMAASRLIAPYFGTSLFVWTNLIGIIMLFLTAGYYAGGRIADKNPHVKVMASITFWTGAYFAILPFMIRPVMKQAIRAIELASVPAFYSWLVFSVAIISLPMAALGMISPLAIRIKSRNLKEVGSVSGRIYAIGTAGSIIGTFIPALLTIPLIGTKNTFVLFGFALMIASATGMKSRKKTAAAAALLILLAVNPAIKAEPGLVFEDESAYNYIQIIREGGSTYLKLNEGNAFHSQYNEKAILTGSVWDYFLILPHLKEGRNRTNESMLIIGLAGGTISRQYNHFYPEISIDGVEIDRQIIETAREYMGLGSQKVRIYISDGRTFLESTEKKYDYIIIDAYRQPYIPFHLATREFFELTKNKLSENGVTAINIGATDKNSRLYKSITNTMASVYGTVYSVDVPNTFNHIVIGMNGNAKAGLSDADPAEIEVKKLVRYAEHSIERVEHDQKGPVFTDDRAPVELLTDLMIIDYAEQI